MAGKKRRRDKRKKMGAKRPAAKKNRQLVAVQSEKYFDIPGKMTAVSLELPAGLEYKEWSVIGPRLVRIREFTNFAIGDWLCYGEGKYGEMFAQAASETGIPEDRLTILKYVSMHVAPARRIDRPNFWSHHREVASLEPGKQTWWLEKSAENNWTVRELKEALKKKPRKTDEKSNINKCVRCYEHEAVFSVCNECFGMIPDRKPMQDKSAA